MIKKTFITLFIALAPFAAHAGTMKSPAESGVAQKSPAVTKLYGNGGNNTGNGNNGSGNSGNNSGNNNNNGRGW